jgi:hypothetical protein
VSQLNDFVGTHLGVIGLVLIIGCVVVLLLVLMLYIQSRRIALLSERLDYLTKGADGESLEAILNTHIDTVLRVAHDLDEVQARTAMLEGSARLHFSRLGLVRFNPFDDTGGNQSFALAMLDSNNDGFVVSSLHSRTGTRLYAKAVFGGEAESVLGAEEAQAIDIAVSQGGGSAGPKARGTSSRGSGRSKSVGSAAKDGSATSSGAQGAAAAPESAPARIAKSARSAPVVSAQVATNVPDSAPDQAAGEAPAAAVAASEPEPAEAGRATPPD